MISARLVEGRKDDLMKLLDFLRTHNLPYTILRCTSAFTYKWFHYLRRKHIKRIFCFLFIVGGYVFVFPLPSAGESDPDVFIATIDKMKQSIGPIICMRPGGIQVNGSGFFLDEHGTFLTAGHVVREFMPAGALHTCTQAAVYFPIEKWSRGDQQVIGFQFLPEKCIFDGLVDVVRCRTVNDLASFPGLHWKPIGVTWAEIDEPDGTPVAFTGFPLSAVIPLTARAHIAAYPIPFKPGETHFEMDITAWPGASGSPVYIANGNVVGLVIQRGEGGASGISIAVDSRAIGRFLRTEQQR
jgi:S1-C subfamily serine protease